MIQEYLIYAVTAFYLLVVLAVYRAVRREPGRYGRSFFKAFFRGLLWPLHLFWAPIWRFGRWLAWEAE